MTAALYFDREFNRAIEQAKKTLELDPGFPLGRSFLALAYMGQGSYIEAVAELEKVKAILGVLPSRYAGELGYAYTTSGRRPEALRMLAELEERSKHEYVLPIGACAHLHGARRQGAGVRVAGQSLPGAGF